MRRIITSMALANRLEDVRLRTALARETGRVADSIGYTERVGSPEKPRTFAV
jgi:hypothetical protein